MDPRRSFLSLTLRPAILTVSRSKLTRNWPASAGTRNDPNELWIGHRDEPNELLVADARHMRPDARRFVKKAGAYREGFDETFRLLFRDVYAHIAAGDVAPVPHPTFTDGHRQLVVHEAIQTSVSERRWVDLDWSAFDSRA